VLQRTKFLSTATANLSTGGIAVDRTDDIHPKLWLAQRSRLLVYIAGIDIVTPDISRPLREVDGVVEAAPPGFGCTLLAAAFPATWRKWYSICCFQKTQLIPILLSQAPMVNYYYATTGTINKLATSIHNYRWHIGDHMVEPGDTGPQCPQSSQDPTVEVAVLESARGGIFAFRAGL